MVEAKRLRHHLQVLLLIAGGHTIGRCHDCQRLDVLLM
jgi:hypothetical protein